MTYSVVQEFIHVTTLQVGVSLTLPLVEVKEVTPTNTDEEKQDNIIQNTRILVHNKSFIYLPEQKKFDMLCLQVDGEPNMAPPPIKIETTACI